MSEKDPKGSVHKEQFGNAENMEEQTNNKEEDKTKQSENTSEEVKEESEIADLVDKKQESVTVTDDIPPDKKADKGKSTSKSEKEKSLDKEDDAQKLVDDDIDVEGKSEETVTADEEQDKAEAKKQATADKKRKKAEKTDKSDGDAKKDIDEDKKKIKEKKQVKVKATKSKEITGKSAETKSAEPESEKKPASKKSESSEIKSDKEGIKKGDTDVVEKSEKKVVQEPEIIDYTKLSKEDLVAVLNDLINNRPVPDIRKDVETIKSNFYKKNKQDNEKIKEQFIAEGGLLEDFKIEISPEEIKLRELLEKYRELRNEYNKKQEEEKVVNLEEKYKIIEAIKELVNSQESLNKTFHDFRELQQTWRDIGPVPQQNLKDLWESYHYQVEAFYDYIKINKELRDLDLKKNLEAKMKLCERAEELLLEPSVVEAFRQLQKLHDRWREIGPVPIEKRNEIWERFKETTTKINRKHQEYFVNLKQEQRKNYEEKIALCEKSEEIAALELGDHKEWEEKSKELVELQKVWKTIGFAPKKYNNEVYERFRNACDLFFNKKREYYSQNREEQQNNLQLKTELCIQAEALQDNTDWKKTTEELIALQKKWKEIGPVPIKHSDKIWKRFRAACDKFFNSKSEYYSKIDTRYEENLDKKKELIDEIEKFDFGGSVEENLTALKNYQRQWSEIGYVPIKDKNEIQDRYRKAINDKFDHLKLDDNKKALLKYRNKLEGIMGKPNAQNRLRIERDKCFNKLKQLENDITLWENNIGFFADSENAESLISDVNYKIENAKKKIEQLKGKINMLDEYDK
ncbi:MAG: DUF349 domain-containing protein [Bacteroidales bacterium]|nr:DUF349 domain-containing protein [Bacteroidales bacterium]